MEAEMSSGEGPRPMLLAKVVGGSSSNYRNRSSVNIMMTLSSHIMSTIRLLSRGPSTTFRTARCRMVTGRRWPFSEMMSRVGVFVRYDLPCISASFYREALYRIRRNSQIEVLQVWQVSAWRAIQPARVPPRTAFNSREAERRSRGGLFVRQVSLPDADTLRHHRGQVFDSPSSRTN
jgi:hypothetical protein